MSKKKCKKCGKEIEKNIKFCMYCGNKIPSNKKVVLIVSIIVATILAVVLLASFLIPKPKKGNNVTRNIYGNEPFNMTSNSGNFIRYGDDWLIYSNGVSNTLGGLFTSGTKEGIYKYNLKTGQTIKLYDYDGINLNIINNKLYYTTKYGNIYTVNLDTLKSDWISRVNGDNYEADKLLICDGYIYYRERNGKNLYRTDLEGNGKALVAEYIDGTFQVYNNCIYYIDAQSYNLYKREFKKDSSPIQLVEGPLDKFYCKNDRIIYRIKDDLKMLSTSDNSTQTLKSGVTSNFVIDSSSNIYVYVSDSKSIIKLNLLDQSEETILDNIDSDIYRLQFFNDTLYYSCSKKSEWSSTIITTLYSLNVNDKEAQKLQINTK